MPLSASDIATAVTQEDDFGFELKVGSAAKGIPAIFIRHGGTYTDPVTAKPRQYDYRCWLRKENRTLALAVECKNLNASFPLVVSGLPRSDNESFIDIVESRQGRYESGYGTVVGLSSITRRALNTNSFYRPSEFVGKSLLRVRIEKKTPIAMPDSDVYDRWAQALSSAVALANNACEISKRHKVAMHHTAILPTLVVPDNSLWRIDYDERGNSTSPPKLVSECDLYVGRHIRIGLVPIDHSFVFSHIHFFTLSGFTSFLSKMAVNDHAWDSLFATVTDEVI